MLPVLIKIWALLVLRIECVPYELGSKSIDSTQP
jgi:hypothetical protein